MPVQAPQSKLLSDWLDPFRSCLTRPTFRHALVLVAGAILTPGRRTVTAMLNVVGRARAPTFTNYHRVLNRNRWSSRAVAHRLLTVLVAAFIPAGPVIIGLDDALERRWGARIKARGIYPNPVRSSQSLFVKASGLRWLSVMLLAPIPWAKRVWALPILTVAILLIQMSFLAGRGLLCVAWAGSGHGRALYAGDLSDEEWALLAPLLPRSHPARHEPRSPAKPRRARQSSSPATFGSHSDIHGNRMQRTRPTSCSATNGYMLR
jgi:hypothetical protein